MTSSTSSEHRLLLQLYGPDHAGRWALGVGRWALGVGRWALGVGRWALGKLQQAGRRALKRLVDDLLNVSRISVGKLTIAPQEVNFADIVHAARETVITDAERRGIAVVEEELASIPVLADPHRLQQVAWNLLSTAVKFSPEGSSAHISLRHIPAGALLTVRDNGKGIPASLLPHVFNRFSKERNCPLTAASPAWVAIARSIVELHGGSITAESAGPSLGATFRVVLPVSEQSRKAWGLR